MRAFVQVRKLATSYEGLQRKLAALEQRFEDHDEKIEAIFEAIRQLMAPPKKEKKKIGFEVKEGRVSYGKRSKRC